MRRANRSARVSVARRSPLRCPARASRASHSWNSTFASAGSSRCSPARTASRANSSISRSRRSWRSPAYSVGSMCSSWFGHARFATGRNSTGRSHHPSPDTSAPAKELDELLALRSGALAHVAKRALAQPAPRPREPHLGRRVSDAEPLRDLAHRDRIAHPGQHLPLVRRKLRIEHGGQPQDRCRGPARFSTRLSAALANGALRATREHHPLSGRLCARGRACVAPLAPRGRSRRIQQVIPERALDVRVDVANDIPRSRGLAFARGRMRLYEREHDIAQHIVGILLPAVRRHSRARRVPRHEWLEAHVELAQCLVAPPSHRRDELRVRHLAPTRTLGNSCVACFIHPIPLAQRPLPRSPRSRTVRVRHLVTLKTPEGYMTAALPSCWRRS